MTEFDPAIVQAFVEESLEQLESFADDLLSIEAGGDQPDPEIINRAFRAVHSVKGGAGFMALDRISELSHAMENVLNQVRNEGLVLTGDRTSHLLQASDTLTAMLRDTATSNDVDIAAHLQVLERIAAGAGGAADSGDAVVAAPDPGQPAGPEPGASAAPITMPDGAAIYLQTSPERASEALQTLDYIYLVQYLPDDLEGGRTASSISDELAEVGGQVLESLEQDNALYILFATAIDPEVISALVEVPETQFRAVQPDELARAGAAVSGATVSDDGADGAEAEAEDLPLAGHDGRVELTPEAMILAGDPPPGDDAGADGDWWLEDDGADEEGLAPAGAAPETPAPATPQPPVAPPAPQAPGPAAPTGAAAASTPATLAPAAPPAGDAAPQRSPVAETSLRVHVELLDDLMTLAGELVLTRNQLIQEVVTQDIKAIDASTQRLDQVTTELQEAIVSTRMQPVGGVFGKFRRIVRDLSADLGKPVELTIEGEEVELDKTIIEALGDPLTHLVRNAMDHGIETPDVRAQAGKPVPASLQLRARHEAGQVLIEVADDGAGIDAERIRAKAQATGLAEPGQLSAMSDRDVVRLIFHAGFSTAEAVSDLSGRGVGMDVVHTNLTQLGGVVDIDTQVGAGTTISITLPLTLAIIPSLLVEVGDERFAIPQVNIAELVRIAPEQLGSRIQTIGDARVLRLRERLVPLVTLREVLGIGGQDTATAHDGATHVAVLKAGEAHFGLQVDELLDSREIVVKPLDGYLADCAIYAGGTILGDGSVALILDVVGLSQRISSEEVGTLQVDLGDAEPDRVRSDDQKLLLVHNAPGERFALPLSLVSRIEAIQRDQIQVAGGRPCIQYRGGHLVLFSLHQAADVTPLPKLDELFVVVFRAAGREVGLLVSEAIDIVIEAIQVEEQGFRQPGIAGSTIVGGQTTLMVDLYSLVRHIDPQWIAEYEEQLRGDATVLLAEDTPFFREQMRRCLEGAGHQVIATEDGVEALETLKSRAEEIDLVVSDVEMPRLDGLGLTRAIKADPRFGDLPVIVVTSLSADADRQRGVEAGVDDYLIKLDQEQLLQSVRRHLGGEQS